MWVILFNFFIQNCENSLKNFPISFLHLLFISRLVFLHIDTCVFTDDTFLFTSDTDEIWPKMKLEHNIPKIYDFFAMSQLLVNKQKTEYFVFSTRKRLTNTVLNVDKERIAESNTVKYLGVIIDSTLKLDGEVKKTLQRMACGIKVLNTLSNFYQRKRKTYYLVQ